MQYLEFEKPLLQLNKQINDLRALNKNKDVNITKEIKELEEKSNNLSKKIYSNLSDWEIIQISRHPDRPYSLDFINTIFNDFQELHGDRVFGDDHAIVSGLAKINSLPVMIIAQQKGRSLKERLYRNFAMPHPEGYRKALRLMKLAEKFQLPIITFIDTPGAYPGIQAEERGQSQAIALNLRTMADLEVPIINVVIGEGCSGGALGIGIGDKITMMEYSYYATISPEGCASILWKDATKAALATETMNITAKKLLKYKIIDSIIQEPIGGAHKDIKAATLLVKDEIVSLLNELNQYKIKDLLENRYNKLTSYGEYNNN